MSALNEDAPVSDGNNHAYVMDLREIFIHVCGDRAIDRVYVNLRAFTEDAGNGYCYLKFWFYVTIYVRRETKDGLSFTKCHDILEAVYDRENSIRFYFRIYLKTESDLVFS